MRRFRHYCKKCGLTWFDESERSRCPDCLQEKTKHPEVDDVKQHDGYEVDGGSNA